MSNVAVIPQVNLPAEIMQQFAALNGANDLAAGVSAGFPVISIRGAKWRIVEGGEEHPIYMPGTTDLAPSIKVVILKANPNVSKTYYAGAYVEGTDAKPDCYSNNGVAPEADSPNPQCATCAQCPQNVWGSKISPNGSKIKACADVRRIAVLPVDDLSYSPILLRVPAASLGDLASYGRALGKRNIPYAMVSTKLSFDPEAAYPKIMFQFDRVLTQEELATVADRITDPVVDDVLGLNASRGAAAAPAEDKFGIPADVAPPAQVAQPAPQPEPAPAAAPAAAPAPEKPKTTRKKAAGFAAAPEPAQAAPEPAPAPAASGNAMDDDIEKALAELGL